MPVVQGRTREQIRVSVGYNLQALYVSSTTSTVDRTSVIDATLRGGDDAHNGKWVVQTSGTNDEEIRQVSDYTQSSTDMTVAPSFTNSVASGVTYELWNEQYNPARINDFIDQTIIEVTGRVYDPETDVSLHTDGNTTTYSIPSQFAMINKIEQRKTVTSTRIHDCESDFDEVTTPTGISKTVTSTRIHDCSAAFDSNTVSNFTSALDTKDRRQGTSSVQFDIGASVSAGAFLYDTISGVNLSKYDYIEFWVKSSIATSAAGNLKLHLDNAAITADGNDLESLNIPALSADTWTYVRVALSQPENDTAIVSVGLEYDSDYGSSSAVTVWLDDIKAVVDASASWEKIQSHLWGIDKNNRKLVFTNDGRSAARYNLLRLTGGDQPAIMTADSSTCEVDEGYVIARATALALSASWGLPDPGEARRMAQFWMALSEQAKARMPMLQGVRTVD